MCAAPGGKTFQLICNNAKVVSYDKNKNKISLMKNNLLRLNYNNQIIESFPIKVLSSPCETTDTVYVKNANLSDGIVNKDCL